MKEDIDILKYEYRRLITVMINIENILNHSRYRTVKNCKMLIRIKNRLYKDTDLLYKVIDMLGWNK